MPRVQAVYDDYHERGYEPLAINHNEDAGTVKDFARQYGFSFLRNVGRAGADFVQRADAVGREDDPLEPAG